jgi:hypothetical protein
LAEPDMKKRPPAEPEGVLLNAVVGEKLRSLPDGLTSDVGNVGAADAEVVELAVAHTAEFVAGLTILAPIVERTCEVHDPIPFLGSCQRFVSLAGRHLMVGNIIDLSAEYRDDAASHPCMFCKPLHTVNLLLIFRFRGGRDWPGQGRNRELC